MYLEPYHRYHVAMVLRNNVLLIVLLFVFKNEIDAFNDKVELTYWLLLKAPPVRVAPTSLCALGL
jgi:hypothetical protein